MIYRTATHMTYIRCDNCEDLMAEGVGGSQDNADGRAIFNAQAAGARPHGDGVWGCRRCEGEALEADLGNMRVALAGPPTPLVTATATPLIVGRDVDRLDSPAGGRSPGGS